MGGQLPARVDALVGLGGLRHGTRPLAALRGAQHVIPILRPQLNGSHNRAGGQDNSHFHIEKDIPFHLAFGDSYYTAKVFKKMENPEILELVSFDTFHLPRNRKEEIKIIFPGYAKHISREFEEKKEVMEDREIASTKCYLCHKNLKKKIRWYTPNGKHYYSVAYCDTHGYIKYKVRVKKSEEEKYYAVKTAKFTTEEKIKKQKI